MEGHIFNIEVRVWGPSKPIGFLVGPIFTKIIQDTHENQVICTLSNNGIIMMSKRFARLKQDDSRLTNLDFDILVPDWDSCARKAWEDHGIAFPAATWIQSWWLHENQVICTLSSNGVTVMSQKLTRLTQDESSYWITHKQMNYSTIW